MKTITTNSEYLDAKNKIEKYDFCIREYCAKNKTNGIPCEITKTFPFADEVTNKLRSSIELWEFNKELPKNYFCYVDFPYKKVTTWTGQKLGDIIYMGREFKSNMGDKRQYLKVLAINGLTYWGYFYKSSGDYCRLKSFH